MQASLPPEGRQEQDRGLLSPGTQTRTLSFQALWRKDTGTPELPGTLCPCSVAVRFSRSCCSQQVWGLELISQQEQSFLTRCSASGCSSDKTPPRCPSAAPYSMTLAVSSGEGSPARQGHIVACIRAEELQKSGVWGRQGQGTVLPHSLGLPFQYHSVVLNKPPSTHCPAIPTSGHQGSLEEQKKTLSDLYGIGLHN